MQKSSLLDVFRGWFVGDFTPTIYKTQAVEVAVKRYNKGDRESSHYHKIATEITVIVQGEVVMNGIDYGPDDIIVIKPNEAADFEVVSDDAVTCVVKLPGAPNDKYENIFDYS